MVTYIFSLKRQAVRLFEIFRDIQWSVGGNALDPETPHILTGLQPMKPLSILLIEDEGLIAINTQIIIETMGHSVQNIAATGKEALAFAEKERPDIALVDIKLKGAMNGIETATQLKERLGVPIMYITGNTDQKTLEEAMKIKPLAILQKPYDESDLENAIETVLSLLEKHQEDPS